MSANKLGRYELIRVLGKGAMGLVFEGRDPNLDRLVAIKTIRVESLSPTELNDYEFRFRTEARSAARLQHPNIVSVYDSDRDGDIAYLVMEHVQGDDLKHHLDRGARYTLDESLRMVGELLGALDYAHQQGVIHRDVKPANLLMEPSGRIKLTDFGVARMQDSGDHTRTKGSIVGTLKYMSPEQVQGLAIDARADLFSAAVVLYQLLTGHRPFNGDNDFAVIHQIIDSIPAAPSRLNPQLPPALDAVMVKALAKSRDQRYATAQEFAAALWAAGQQAQDRTIVPPAARSSAELRSTPDSRRLLSATGLGVTTPGEATSPSQVAQEMELVYWKDVKDSTEPDDLHGFLERFPFGVYASLAKKRLLKLAEGNGPVPSPSPQSTAPVVPSAPTESTEPTERRDRVAGGSSHDHDESTRAQLAALREALKPQVLASVPDIQAGSGFGAVQASSVQASSPRPSAPPAHSASDKPVSKPPSKPPTHPMWRGLWAVGAALVAGLLIWGGMRGQGGPHTPAPADAAVASGPTEVASGAKGSPEAMPSASLPSAGLASSPATLAKPASAMLAPKGLSSTDKNKAASMAKAVTPTMVVREPVVVPSAPVVPAETPTPKPVASVPPVPAKPASVASQPSAARPRPVKAASSSATTPAWRSNAASQACRPTRCVWSDVSKSAVAENVMSNVPTDQTVDQNAGAQSKCITSPRAGWAKANAQACRHMRAMPSSGPYRRSPTIG